MGCGGGSSGGSSGGGVQYTMPPQQRQMYQIAKPLAQQLARAARDGKGAWGVLPATAVPKPTAANYDIPDAVAPTSGWWKGMDANVKKGLWEPYQQGSDILKEQMNSMGQLGNTTMGVSGAGAAGLGRFWEDASKDVGLQGWQVMQPGLMKEWDAKLAQGILGNMRTDQYRQQVYQGLQGRRAEQMEARKAPFAMMPSYLGGVSGMSFGAQPQGGGNNTISQVMSGLGMAASILPFVTGGV